MSTKWLKAILISASLISLAGHQPAYAEDRIAHLRYLASAELNWQMQKREEALKEMDKCIEAYSGNAAAFAARASMRGTQGDNKGALDDCNRALYLKPDLDYAKQIRAVAKAALNDYKGAIEDLDSLLSKRVNDSKLYAARAEIYCMAENEKLARKDIDRALELDPSNARAQKALVIWYLQFQKYKEALPIAEKYVVKNPKSADAYSFLARAYSGNGQNQKSIENCTQAIKLDSKYYRAFTSRGYNKMILKDYKGSLEDSESSIKLNPKNGIPVQNMALVYFMQGDYLKAAELYKKAAGLYDKKERQLRAHLMAAFTYRLVGKTKESQSELALSKKDAEKTNFATLVSYMEGSVKEDKVLAVTPSLDYQRPAKLMMAIELLRQKKTSEARNYFNWLVANGDRDEDEMYIAKAFLERKSLP